MNHNLEEKLTAYALGEIDGVDAVEIEALLETDEDAKRYVEEIRAIGDIAEEAFAGESLGEERHEAILAYSTITSIDSRRRFTSMPSQARLAVLAASAVFVAGLAYISAGYIEGERNPIMQAELAALEEADSVLADREEKRRYLNQASVSDAAPMMTEAELAQLKDITLDELSSKAAVTIAHSELNHAESQIRELRSSAGGGGLGGRGGMSAGREPTTFNIIDGRDRGAQAAAANRRGVSMSAGYVNEEVGSLPPGADPKGILPPAPKNSATEFASTADSLDALGVGAADPNDGFITGRQSSSQQGQSSNRQNIQVGGEIRVGKGAYVGGGGGRGGQAGGRSYQFDVNGDGVLETVPFYTRSDGASVIPESVEQQTRLAKRPGINEELPALADIPVLTYEFRGRSIEELEQLQSLGYLGDGTDNLANVSALQARLGSEPPDSFGFPHQQQPEPNTESYDRITDNPFKRVVDEPLSTFSIDVDTGSYSNVRRFLRNNQLPPKDAVRIEELLNYFKYAYAPPANDDPFAAHVELIECPWNDAHQLMRIGLKGREVEVHTRPPANLVFLLDVSGSMNNPNKLPLVRNAMKMLTKQLRPDDRVAIVTYAGASGLVLPSTPGEGQATILNAIGRLQSGGSTNGGAGIELAYKVAQENFLREGANRVILATDGDFNVGTTDRGSLDRLIEEKAKSGVFLTVLGVGEGNLKDAMMEQLADKGNGQYAYLDTEREARKVLVDQVSGTLVTIAKDVKIQIDFNPAQVGAYRLIGYENRVLAAQDFDDDTKDAGEIGAGHTVTALYEIVPPGVTIDAPSGTQSRYQVAAAPEVDTDSTELLTVKLRHKKPDGDTSELLEIPINAEAQPLAEASRDSRFAAAVASFGMALRESPYRGSTDWDLIANLAEDGLGNDPHGYRAEFMEMIQVARRLKPGIALQQQAAAVASPVVELIKIMPWTGGTYVAEIRTQNARPKRYGVGDQFESYQIISIDPSAGKVVLYSEEHRRNLTLRISETANIYGSAENRYRKGIDKYQQGEYREAFNEFSRALALEPTMEKARDMLEKARGRLALSKIGEDTQPNGGRAIPPTFEELEQKYTKVKELMEQGEFYLENKKYDRALEFFEDILVVDPKNKEATRKLAEATLGAYAEDVRTLSERPLNPLIGTDIKIVDIQPSTGGQYVAVIRIGDDEAKRYRVGESFDSYRVESIDPSKRKVVLFSEEHRAKIVIDVTKLNSNGDQHLIN